MTESSWTVVPNPDAKPAEHVETRMGYKCQDCEAIINPDEQDVDITLYECGQCGTRFNRDISYADNHQCPDCLKFSSKVAEMSCPECQAGELDEIEIAQDENGDWVEVDETELADDAEQFE